VPGAATGRLSAAGVALGLGGALGQAGGLVLSKLGMGAYDAFAATQIRVTAGGLGYVALFFVLGRWGRVRRALADRRAMAATGVGAFFGPFLGVSLSLLAVQRTATGVAASIMAVTPVLIIPVAVLWGGERVGTGGVIGAVLAVTGVAVLFLA
jgi:drug/metabolite transporter (DMT)-like permease